MFWATERSLWVRYVFIAFGLLILCVIVPIALYNSWQAYRASQDCPNWPTVPGVVSNATEYEERRKGKTFYTIFVHYSYEVDGKRYNGTKVSPAATHSPEERDRIIKAYPSGSTPSVAYNPTTPSEAFLEPTPYPGAILNLLASFAIAPVGLLFLGVGWVLRKKRRPPGEEYVPKRHRRQRD